MIPERPLFWEIQRRQKRLSFLILFFLFIFYFISLGLLTAGLFIIAGFFLPGFNFWLHPYFLKYLIFVFFFSLILTVINFFQARKAGASYVLNRLQAYPPQSDDRYHLAFQHVLEEMKLASGLPEIKGYIIPSLNINSFSLIDQDRKPAVGITEGLIAEASRDELQAVVAHEVAHILKGDTYLLTLICSLASFFEQLLTSLEKEREKPAWDILNRRSQKEVIHPFLYLAGLISYFLMFFFSTFISRQRELLADATAVELCRDPMALARIIYKAQLANSYLGDFSLYTPLFLVPPDSREIKDNLFGRLFNTHPPAQMRLRLLTSMAHMSWRDLISQIKEQEEIRAKAKIEMKAQEERREKARMEIEDKEERQGEGPKEIKVGVLGPSDLTGQPASKSEEKIWMVKGTSGQWEGPYSLNSLLALPFFSPGLRVKNIKENKEGKAKDFTSLRQAFYRLYRQQPVDPQRQNKCPHCQTELIEDYYEGVKIKTCPNCQGKLVTWSSLERIMARKEIGFSLALKEKAKEIEKNLTQPAWLKKRAEEKAMAYCPQCGLQMIIKPYSYLYLFPVYKCFHCSVIWFEADELEILQFISEKQLGLKLARGES